MSATYGTLRSDKSDGIVTKQGRDYVEARVQTETVRAIVDVTSDGTVRIDLRATSDRFDSGATLAYITLRPIYGDNDRPSLLVEPTDRVIVPE